MCSFIDSLKDKICVVIVWNKASRYIPGWTGTHNPPTSRSHPLTKAVRHHTFTTNSLKWQANRHIVGFYTINSFLPEKEPSRLSRFSFLFQNPVVVGFSLLWLLTCTESVCELSVFYSLLKPLFINYKIMCGGSKICSKVASGHYAGSELHSSHLGGGRLGDSLLTKTIW